MSKKELRESLVQLVKELDQSGYSKRILDAAKTCEVKKVDEVLNNFKTEKEELYKRIKELGDNVDKYDNAETIEEIFGLEISSEGEVDLNKMNFSNFCIMVMTGAFLFFLEEEEQEGATVGTDNISKIIVWCFQ